MTWLIILKEPIDGELHIHADHIICSYDTALISSRDEEGIPYQKILSIDLIESIMPKP